MRKYFYILILISLIPMLMGAGIATATLKDKEPMVDLSKVIEKAKLFSPHEISDENPEDDPEKTEDTEEPEEPEKPVEIVLPESSEIIVSVHKKTISIDGKAGLQDSFDKRFSEVYDAKKKIILEENYADYHTYIFVEGYFKEKGIKYSAREK